jgi:hypothetical protein
VPWASKQVRESLAGSHPGTVSRVQRHGSGMVLNPDDRIAAVPSDEPRALTVNAPLRERRALSIALA